MNNQKMFNKYSKRLKNIKLSLKDTKSFSLENAIETLKTFPVKFDQTLDVVVKLGVDPKHADQNVRGAIALPNGTGKTVKIAVFAKGEKAEEAKAAGADIVGSDDLVQKIMEGVIDFDKCVATPDMMPTIAKAAKILGPKGLMPNPKLGTVTMNLANAIKEIKAGQVEFRAEKNGIIHLGAGKVSFDTKALIENIKTVIKALQKARPSGAKGTYIQKVYLSSTMGPALSIDLSDVITA